MSLLNQAQGDSLRPYKALVSLNQQNQVTTPCKQLHPNHHLRIHCGHQVNKLATCKRE